MNGDALFGASAIPLIVGLIQVFKVAGLPAKLSPLAALLLGLVAGVISVWQTVAAGTAIPWAAGVVLGISWGLGASGLYEAGKATASIYKNGSAASTAQYPAPKQ